MVEKPGKIQRTGLHFPIAIFHWDDRHTYLGSEIEHLWFSQVFGTDAYGNLVVTWRGPMNVELENIKDQTERIGWDKGVRISGPDLFHVIAEFPQIGSNLTLMYAFQAILADELACLVLELGSKAVMKGTDIYIDAGKLNVGVCAATATSCTMHFAVNIGLKGIPPIPKGVKVSCLSQLLQGDEEKAVELMQGVVSRWVSRIDAIYLKTYKTA